MVPKNFRIAALFLEPPITVWSWGDSNSRPSRLVGTLGSSLFGNIFLQQSQNILSAFHLFNLIFPLYGLRATFELLSVH